MKRLFNSIVAIVMVVGIIGIVYTYSNRSKTIQLIQESSHPSVTSPPLNTRLSLQPSIRDTDIRSGILRDIVSNDIQCPQKDSCKVDTVIDEYAKGTMPMAYWIAIQREGRWKVVITGNGIPSCIDIDKNSIPKELYGNCIESSGQLRF